MSKAFALLAGGSAVSPMEEQWLAEVRIYATWTPSR